ncbi:uncharacterized protein Dyak_GE27801, partial [Drosophila yakuba]
MWAEASEKGLYIRGLESTHRLCALRVCSGFLTISDDAAQVIAGTLPIDVLALEAKEMYHEVKKIVGQCSRPRSEPKKTTPEPTAWKGGKNGGSSRRRDYGPLGSSRVWSHGREDCMARFGHDDDSHCPECGVDETAEHIIFICLMEDITHSSTLGERMISDQTFWGQIGNFAAVAMKRLR